MRQGLLIIAHLYLNAKTNIVSVRLTLFVWRSMLRSSAMCLERFHLFACYFCGLVFVEIDAYHKIHKISHMTKTCKLTVFKALMCAVYCICASYIPFKPLCNYLQYNLSSKINSSPWDLHFMHKEIDFSTCYNISVNKCQCLSLWRFMKFYLRF